MKRESLRWIVAGMVVVMVCTLGAMQQAPRAGRFQIVNGVMAVGERGEQGSGNPCSMLLDTDTGTTRIFTFGKSGVRWDAPVEVSK